MSKRTQYPATPSVALVDPGFVAPQEGQLVFLKDAVGDGTPVIREGQRVSYELVQGQDGLWYAINIVIEDEQPLD
ncbi:cold-shock protein [Pseudomonas sp. NPDC087029]|uniref:cold-shock protein n=1 Tax=Pseudomonas sp. NPDC087029 TaxID=3364433 RepID=UPI00381C5113